MKRPVTLGDANRTIEKLLFQLAYEKIKYAKKLVQPNMCPFKVLGNDINAIEYCGEKSCTYCMEKYWNAYENKVFTEHVLED